MRRSEWCESGDGGEGETPTQENFDKERKREGKEGKEAD